MAREKAQKKAKKNPGSPGKIAQIRQTYRMTKERDPRIGLILLGCFVVFGAIAAGLMWLVFRSWIFPPLIGVLTGILAVLIVFGRRAQKAAIGGIEGQPGASAAVLGMLRRGWQVGREPIAFTRQQDIVFRVVGPPGIVLVAEGNANRLKPLIAAERKKHERVASEVPIHEVYVGNDEGQVPLTRLVKHVTKLGRHLKPAQMTDVLQRIKALDAQRSTVPIPKGPMPTSARQAMRGARNNLKGR